MIHKYSSYNAYKIFKQKGLSGLDKWVNDYLNSKRLDDEGQENGALAQRLINDSAKIYKICEYPLIKLRRANNVIESFKNNRNENKVKKYTTDIAKGPIFPPLIVSDIFDGIIG